MFLYTINSPTLLTSAGAIVLLICSTAFETPAKDKQTMTDPDRGGACRAGRTDEHRAARPPLRGWRSGSFSGSFDFCEHLSVPAQVRVQSQTHSPCCGTHTPVCKRVVPLFNTVFTWLHKAGAKNSFTYLTALLTPNRRKKDGAIRNEEPRNRTVQDSTVV